MTERQRQGYRTDRITKLINVYGDRYVLFPNGDYIIFMCKKHGEKEKVKLSYFNHGTAIRKHFCPVCRDEIKRAKRVKIQQNRIDNANKIIERDYADIYEVLELIGEGNYRKIKVVLLNKFTNEKNTVMYSSICLGMLTKKSSSISKKRIRGEKIVSYDDAKERVNKANIKTFREYRAWRNKYNIESLPAHPNRVYKNNGFIDYYDFFNTNRCRDMSQGEIRISNELKRQGIVFETEKTFEGCKNKRLLRFDFWLPEYNLLIEFDGEQHNKDTNHWKKMDFERLKENDAIKNKFCEDNNIYLERIVYSVLINNDVERHIEYLRRTYLEKNGFEKILIKEL